MKTSKKLKEERAAKITEAQGLVSLAETEKREFNADEQTKFDALNTEIERFDTEILSAEKREKLTLRNVQTTPVTFETTTEEKETREKSKFSFSKLVTETRGSDTTKVSGLELEMLQESSKEAREKGLAPQGIYLSDDIMGAMVSRNRHLQKMLGREQRAMTAGTLGAGGYLIPTEKIGFFDALYALTILDAAGVIKLTGLSANSDLPGFSVAVATGWASGETGTQSPADATVVNRALRPNLIYGATDISKRLMIQTNDSIDAYILGSIMKSMAVAIENAVINGDGSNKPTGILGTSGIGNVAIGTNGGALTLANILKLVQIVQSANGNLANAKFISNFKVAAALKQIPIDSGSGMMIMSYQQYAMGTPNVIDGYQTLLTSNVPSNLTKGTSSGVCSPLIFGDFSQVVVGQFGGVDLMIDNVSAAVVRAGTVAITVNQFVDSALKQPAAIGAILDATT